MRAEGPGCAGHLGFEASSEQSAVSATGRLAGVFAGQRKAKPERPIVEPDVDQAVQAAPKTLADDFARARDRSKFPVSEIIVHGLA